MVPAQPDRRQDQKDKIEKSIKQSTILSMNMSKSVTHMYKFVWWMHQKRKKQRDLLKGI